MALEAKAFSMDTGVPPDGAWLTHQKASRDSAKEPATIAHAMRCTLARPSFLPNTPHTNAPSSGSAMMSHNDCAKTAGSTGAVMKNDLRASIALRALVGRKKEGE